MLLEQILDALNKGGEDSVKPDIYKNWIETYTRISFHSKGIRLPFKIYRNSGYQETYTPPNWDPIYENLVKGSILNRHPREEQWSVDFRKSAFSQVTQDIVIKGLGQLKSAIFQKGNYTLSVKNDVANEYITSNNFDGKTFDEFLSNNLLQEMINDPNAFLCVIEGHFGAFTELETAKPLLYIAPSKAIKGYRENEYLLFEYNGLVLLTKEYQVKLLKGKDGKFSIDKNTLVNHKFGILPAIQLGGNRISDGESVYYESFFQSFVPWAELTLRNMSDHEVLMKNYSYPHKQVVEPVCQTCSGQGKQQEACDDGYCEVDCKTCKGRGTISIGPSDLFVVEAPEKRESQETYTAVKYINPDVAILEYSKEHWWGYYLEAQRSLFIDVKAQGANQSAESKEYDRQKFYLFAQDVSDRIFMLASKVLRFISSYLNVTAVGDSMKYDTSIYIDIVKPKSFSNKGEAELIALYDSFSKDGHDRLLRLKSRKDLISKMYGSDSLEMKKFEILTLVDRLYGYTVNEMQQMAAFGTVSREDIQNSLYSIHEIEILINTIGASDFMTQSIQELSKKIKENLNNNYAKSDPYTSIS